MPAPTEHELDAGLRAMATRAVVTATDAVDVEAELVDFHDCATNDTLQRSNDPVPSRRWVALAAAAALVVVAAGAVIALSQSGDDGEIETAAVETTPPPPESTAATAVVTSPPATAPVSAVVTSTVVDTVVFDPNQLATATAVPTTAGPGETVTITPSSAIAYCGMAAVLVAAIEGDQLVHIGTIEYGAYTSPPIRRGCVTGATGDGPATVQLPAGLDAGEHVLCISDLVAAGCARVTVTAEMTGVAACTGDPLPPPALADGSPVGEPTFTTNESGAQVATWGAGKAVAISQVVGAVPDPFGTDALATYRSGEYVIVFGFSESGVTVRVHGPSSFCPRSYQFSPALQLEHYLYGPMWAEYYANGTPIPSGHHPSVPAPAEYYGSRYDDVQGVMVTHRFSTTGEDLGPVDPVASASGESLADGRRVELVGEHSASRCFNRPIELVDGGVRAVVHADLPVAYSFATTPDGAIVAARLTCDGDTPLSWQLVRTDLRDPGTGVEVVYEEIAAPRPTDSIDSMDQIPWEWVTGISDDGRFVALTDSYNLEQGAYVIVDIESPSQPITIASTCPTASDIVAPPAFFGDTVLLARWCDEGDAVTVAVDEVRLATFEVVRGTRIAGPMLPSYSNTVELRALSPTTYIVAGSDGIEAPYVAVLVVDGKQADISRPVYRYFSFEP